MQEDHALVNEAELDVADLADVRGEGLRFIDFGHFVVGEVGLLQLLEEQFEVFFSSLVSLMVRKMAPAALAVSTKSFQLSGLASSSHRTVGTSSPTYPGTRRIPWPSMKATISSFRESKLS